MARASTAAPVALQARLVSFHHQVQRHLLAMVRDAALAEELTQETYVRALERIDQLRDPHVVGYDPDQFVTMGFAAPENAPQGGELRRRFHARDDRIHRTHLSMIVSRMVNKVHIINTRRACRHTRQTR